MENEIEERIQHHASRLETLTGDENKRIRKRVLATLGKLKKELEEVRSQSNNPPADALTPIPPEATTETLMISNKKRKNKLNLLNNELQDLAQKKCLKQAIKRFKWGANKGLSLNLHSYTNLLNAFVRCVDMSGAEQLFQDMLTANITPNVVVFTVLLKGYAETGALLPMHSLLYSRMPEHHITPNLRTLHAFLRGCIRIGATQACLTILNHLPAWNITLDWTSISHIVYLLSQSLHTTLAITFLSQNMATIDTSPETSPAFEKGCTFYYLARALLCRGDYTEAFKWLQLARELLHESQSQRLRISMKRHLTATVLEEEEGSASNILFREHQQEEIARDMEQLQTVLTQYALTIEAFSGDMQRRYVKQLSRLFHFGINGQSDIEAQLLAPQEMPTGLAVTRGNVLLAAVDKFGLNQIEFGQLGLKRKVFVEQFLNCFNGDGVLDFSRVFAASRVDAAEGSGGGYTGRKLKMEICSGEGDWVVSQAASDAHTDWIAVELRCNRVYDTMLQALLQRLDNLCVLGGDANLIIAERIPSDVIANIFINHPEPPERSAGMGATQGKHLLTRDFFRAMHRVIVPATGTLAIVSDNLQYTIELATEVAHHLQDLYASCSFRLEDRQIQLEAWIRPPENSDAGAAAAGGVKVWRGELPTETGVAVGASSYFDRMWSKGNKKKRWFFFIRKL